MTLAIDIEQRIEQIRQAVRRLKQEAESVYSALVLPTWQTESHGYPQTLYGYMMACFSHIDLLSAYWKGDLSTKNQTERMVGFMERYMKKDREACSLAVKVWRHKLMHTAAPRRVRHRSSGLEYRWLLHWREHLPVSQHFSLTAYDDGKKLSLGLIYLIEDLERAQEGYFQELGGSEELKERLGAVDAKLDADLLDFA